MAAATDYLEREVLDHVLGKNTRNFASPTELYIGLFTSGTADDGTGTELSGNNYTRQSVDFDAATTDAGDNATTASNSADVEFGPATGNWGTITNLAIFDAESGGNMLFHGGLSVDKTITTDDSLRIAAGNLTIELQ